MMTRHNDWPGLLEAFIASQLHRHFLWGLHDCCLFACNAVLVMTGEDLARGYRDTYYTAKDAMKAMHAFGASTVGELADVMADRYGIRVIPPSFAGRGDVMLLHRELGESLGIVALSGMDIWAPGEEGLAQIPIGAGIRAWRI